MKHIIGLPIEYSYPFSDRGRASCHLCLFIARMMIILDRERNLNSKDGWGLMDGSPVGGDKFSLNDDTRKCQLGNREWMVAQPLATSEQ